MNSFGYDTLPCDLENVEQQVNEIQEKQKRIVSALKVLGIIFSENEAEKIFQMEDIRCQIDMIADTAFVLGHNVLTLKAYVKYLRETEQKEIENK